MFLQHRRQDRLSRPRGGFHFLSTARPVTGSISAMGLQRRSGSGSATNGLANSQVNVLRLSMARYSTSSAAMPTGASTHIPFSTLSRAFANRVMVPQAGLEPARLSAIDFESTASTISPLGHSGRRNLEHVPKRGNRLSDRNMLWLFDWRSFCPFRCGHLKGKSSGD